ncbi:MAG: manganese efflux pump [Oscillospiraceae bacterium]|nr:manganese efflux pump [Oscillospiraceae bacterium]
MFGDVSLRDAGEAVVLAAALSADMFVTFLSLGDRGARVPTVSLVIINLVCAGLFSAAHLCGALISPLLPGGVCGAVCFMILAGLGLSRLFESALCALIRRDGGDAGRLRFRAFRFDFLLEVRADRNAADIDARGVISPSAAALLATALSIDGVMAGVSAGADGVQLAIAAPAVLLFGSTAALCGLWFGDLLSHRFRADISPAGGALLIAFAFSKLLRA